MSAFTDTEQIRNALRRVADPEVGAGLPDGGNDRRRRLRRTRPHFA